LERRVATFNAQAKAQQKAERDESERQSGRTRIEK
jgi:hypothetical protein